MIQQMTQSTIIYKAFSSAYVTELFKTIGVASLQHMAQCCNVTGRNLLPHYLNHFHFPEHQVGLHHLTFSLTVCEQNITL